MTKLEKIGYTIKFISNPANYKISKKIGNRLFEISDLSFYFGLIQHQLFKENQVINIIKKLETIDLSNISEKHRNIKLLLDYNFIF